MGAATGGRPTAMGATTIPTRRRTVVLIMGTVIIIQRHTMITRPELTAGIGVLIVPTGLHLGVLVIIPTQAHTRERVRFPHLTAAEVQHKPITHIPARMHKPDKARARTLNGAARMFRGETRVLAWAIIRPRMEL